MTFLQQQFIVQACMKGSVYKRMDRVRERRWREIHFYVERADIHHYYSKNINERKNLSCLTYQVGLLLLVLVKESLISD